LDELALSVSVVYGLNSLYFKAQSLFTQHLLMAKYNGKAIIPPDGVRRDFLLAPDAPKFLPATSPCRPCE
jgi:hypothetical protein